MKTYLFDTFNRYKRFSENLDVKTILCNKSWWVFNDSGEKELYIFNTDGTLIIAVSGRVTNATWQYIPANKSIVVTGNAQSYMVHPAFCDNMLLALQVDGTNEYAFLIDESSLLSTDLRTFNDLVLYFANKEKQAALEEERKKQAALEAEKQRELQAIYEKQQKKKEREEGEDGCFQILSFLMKGCVICLNWYLVPIFLRFLCLNIFGISEESFESYPYLSEICIFTELVLAFILLYKTRSWDFIWGIVPIVQFILIILLLCFC